MRNYTQIDKYLDTLAQDVYPQPADAGHDLLLNQVMQEWESYISTLTNVLDVGCGSDLIALPYFTRWNTEYTGISLGQEVHILMSNNVSIFDMDMNFLEFGDENFNGIFARHVLEHSPMPLLTLMEWHRVSNKYLFLVVPNPDHFGYIGKNHYSMMNRPHLRWLLRRAGWKIIQKSYTTEEYRFICEKMPLVGYEGWAESPLDPKIYEEDRDG
jgi:ubiquinone/menaquinone biosynthesis C-methylase UbiE